MDTEAAVWVTTKHIQVGDLVSLTTKAKGPTALTEVLAMDGTTSWLKLTVAEYPDYPMGMGRATKVWLVKRQG